MCGIVGVIGASKNQTISHQLLTKLFEHSEVRGTDATGFWGCQVGVDGCVVYHKEPIKATQFVHTEQWKRLSGMNLDLLIMHARQSSHGMGDAATNKNNHPFVSTDRSLGLVHNGRIIEYNTLKKRYHTRSECDSEVLLRIFEAARARKEVPECGNIADVEVHEDILHTVTGIKEIFAHSFESHMAVAIGERSLDRRDLWLFHNEKRPLWVMDAREVLGQIFFCSTPDIWQEALRDCPRAMGALGGRRHTIFQMPVEEVWYFSVSAAAPEAGSVYYRFVLDRKDQYTPWDYDGPCFPIQPPHRQVQVICDLDDNDEPKGGTIPTKKNKHRHKASWRDESKMNPTVQWSGSQAKYADEEDRPTSQYEHNSDVLEYDGSEADGVIDEGYIEKYHGLTPMRLDEDNLLVADDRHTAKISKVINQRLEERDDVGYDQESSYDIRLLERLTKEIVQYARNIETTAINMALEQSITHQEFQNNLDSLSIIREDLKGTDHLLNAR